MFTPDTTPGHQRKWGRLLQIQKAACRLVISQGYDGFTMDDLAREVGVSRRTLFNYVPDKPSAVLGDHSLTDHPAVQEFRAGKPTGHPLPDLIHAVELFMESNVQSDEDAAECHRMVNQAMAADDRVRALAFRRFDDMTKLLTNVMCERQGWEPDDLRAKAFAATFLALVQVTLDALTERTDNPPFTDLLREVLAAEREVRDL